MNRKPAPLCASVAFFLPIFLLIASPGSAQDEEEGDIYSRKGGYVSVRGVYAEIIHRDPKNTTENTGGVAVILGFRTNSFAAIELNFEQLRAYAEFGPEPANHERSYAIGVNGKFFMMNGRLQPYAIAGANVLILNKTTATDAENNSDWGFRGGAGMDFYLSQTIALNVEVTYMWGVGDVWQQDYLSVGAGVMYRF